MVASCCKYLNQSPVTNMYLFFDVETTGKPRNWKAPVSNTFNWPRAVQIAWLFYDKDRNLVEAKNYIIQPEGYEIPDEVVRIHGISTEIAKEKGVELLSVLEEFKKLIDKADYLIAHNISFDEKIIGAEFYRKKMEHRLFSSERYCTMREGTYFCKLPGRYGKYKWPTLSELHNKAFGKDFTDKHNARADTQACADCFFKMLDLEVIDIF